MIESSLVYLINDNQYLMLLRNKKTHDINQNKWIGVGGKKEKNESFEECAIRETYEETGLKVHLLEHRGIIDFHYEDKESEKIYVYTSTNFSGLLHECNEGELSWINKNEVLHLNLWEGDRIFLNYILNDKNDLFYLHLFYDKYDKLIEYKLGEDEYE